MLELAVQPTTAAFVGVGAPPGHTFGSDVDSRAYLGRAREAVAAEVSRLLQVLGSGREPAAVVDHQ